jgi:hypothetical protein
MTAQGEKICDRMSLASSAFVLLLHLLTASSASLEHTTFQVPVHFHKQTFAFDFEGVVVTCHCEGLLVPKHTFNVMCILQIRSLS